MAPCSTTSSSSWSMAIHAVEDVQHALTLSKLARTTHYDFVWPIQPGRMRRHDTLIAFDSPEKSEEVMAKINPLFSGLSWINVSCLPYVAVQSVVLKSRPLHETRSQIFCKLAQLVGLRFDTMPSWTTSRNSNKMLPMA